MPDGDLPAGTTLRGRYDIYGNSTGSCRGLTLRALGDDSRITLGLRNLLLELAKANLSQ